MSYINNPSGSGSSSLTAVAMDVVFPAHSDEYLGVVTGLASTPFKVIGEVLYEEGVVVQSGMVWSFNAYQLNSNGFNYRIRVLGDEYWPGPGSVTLKVNYVWSST
jgi:hypothetical protein